MKEERQIDLLSYRERKGMVCGGYSRELSL